MPEPVAPKPAPAQVEPERPAAVDSGPAPMVARDHADTAMLLRELSSLGFGGEDNPPNAPAPSAPRPVQSSTPAAPAAKKRKGLFGRG